MRAGDGNRSNTCRTCFGRDGLRSIYLRCRHAKDGQELVLITDNTAARNSWLVGQVIQTLPDQRGLVRQVKIKTRTSCLDRPITKFCLLQEADSARPQCGLGNLFYFFLFFSGGVVLWITFWLCSIFVD